MAAARERNGLYSILFPPGDSAIDWAAVHARLRSHPHEARMQYKTPALYYFIDFAEPEEGGNPSMALMNDAVDADPEALVDRADGMTPLHHAVHVNRLDILKLLLRKMEDKNVAYEVLTPDRGGDYDNTVYHLARSFDQLELLVKYNPEGLCSTDRFGNIPLLSHLKYAEAWNVPALDLPSFRLLLDYGWERKEMWSSFDNQSRAGVLVSNEDGLTALVQAIYNWDMCIDEESEEGLEAEKNKQFQVMRDVCNVAYSDKLGLENINYDIPLLCSLLNLLAELDARDYSISTPGYNVPSQLLLDVLTSHPEEASAVDPNTGRTPLHILASYAENEWQIPDQITTVLQHGGTKTASVVDNEGMLPLQLGATSGLDSESMRKIADAEKRAARTRDWKTGLLPFHLAAVKGKSFDTAYNLLRGVADLVPPDHPVLTGKRRAVKLGSVHTMRLRSRTRARR